MVIMIDMPILIACSDMSAVFRDTWLPHQLLYIHSQDFDTNCCLNTACMRLCSYYQFYIVCMYMYMHVHTITSHLMFTDQNY